MLPLVPRVMLPQRVNVALTCLPLRRACPQHIMIDLGTGNNNKINWAMNDKQEFVDIVETVRAEREQRGQDWWQVPGQHHFKRIPRRRHICLQVFRGARKGRGLVVSPKDYSTKYR